MEWESTVTVSPRPEEVTYAGITITEPYRWLEEDTEDVLAWQKAMDALATSDLQDAQAFEPLRRLLGDLYVDTYTFEAPRPVGGRWWRRTVPAGRRLPVLQVGDNPAGPWTTLVDLEDLDAGPSPVLALWEPSPDGSRLLYGVSSGGGMQTDLTAIDVASGEVVLDGVPHPMTLFPCWAPGSDAIYYSTVGAEAGPEGVPVPVPQVYEVALGGEPQRVPVELPHPATWVRVNPDGRWALIHCSQTDPRPVYIKDLTVEDAPWQPFLLEREGLAKGVIVGDAYIAIVTGGEAPRGRLVSIPLATPTDESTWTELLPHGDAKLASVQSVAGCLVVCDFPDAAARLRVLELDGTPVREVPLPGPGAVGKFALGHILLILDDAAWTDGTVLSFVWSSLTHAPVVLTYDVARDVLSRASEPVAVLDDALVEVHSTTNRDGGEVLYRVAAPAATSGPRPTIVTGYGGFNVPWLACFVPMAAAWIRAGGVWVHTYLRGGGELGEEQWRAGRMHSKARTFDDLEAVCRDLIASGVTTPDLLGVTGSSNGGLLTGAAITRFPELFRAAVAQVPFLDALGCRRDPQSVAIALADFGNPDDPADAPSLLSWSPVHNVRANIGYPAVLLDSGANDPSAPPWHGRKFAALLAESTTSGLPVLLRVREETGHSQMTEADMALRDAEELAFFARELSLDLR